MPNGVQSRVLAIWLAVWLIAAGLPGATGAARGESASATPAGKQLAWALSTVNGSPAALTEGELRDHVAADFLTVLTVPQLLAVFRSYLAPVAPMTLARVAGRWSGLEVRAVMTTPRGDWRVRLGVDASDRHLIDDLFFEPVPQPVAGKAPARWKALTAQLATVAPQVSFTAAEVTDGTCRPVASLHRETELAIGSSFKLYVLGELARQVAAGEANWDEPLPIRNDLRSQPSGDLRLETAGARFSLAYFAEQMISQSDNTATDHLITRLGRTNVEAMFAAMGHAHPGRNVPLLLTREWFALKLRYSLKAIDAFVRGSQAEKRAFLTGDVDPVANTLTDAEDWPGPYLIDTIEWFASSGDLCRAMAHLHGQSGEAGLAEVQGALALNPGLDFDAKAWRYVGYKGGYETGVKSDSWLLERADGRWFEVSAIINDPKKEINGGALWTQMRAAVDRLAVRR